MQEGALSLMQMAKTSQALARAATRRDCSRSALVTDPTYGGVAASFATLHRRDRRRARRPDGLRRPPGDRARPSARSCPRASRPPSSCCEHGLVDWWCRARRCAAAGRLLAPAAGRAGRPRRRTPAEPAAARLARLRCGADPAALARRPTPGETVRLARHLGRPTTLDYLDRVPSTASSSCTATGSARDCPAVVGGLARLDGRPVMVIGHQKGHTTAELVRPQLRHGQPGRLPQGAPADAPRRQAAACRW